jgi:hypothetical protein
MERAAAHSRKQRAVVGKTDGQDLRALNSWITSPWPAPIEPQQKYFLSEWQNRDLPPSLIHVGAILTRNC